MDNPYKGGAELRDFYAYGWYRGYISGQILQMLVGGEVTKAIKSSREFASVAGSIAGRVDALKTAFKATKAFRIADQAGAVIVEHSGTISREVMAKVLENVRVSTSKLLVSKTYKQLSPSLREFIEDTSGTLGRDSEKEMGELINGCLDEGMTPGDIANRLSSEYSVQCKYWASASIQQALPPKTFARLIANLGESGSIDDIIETAESVNVQLTKNGLRTEVRYMKNGYSYIQGVAMRLGYDLSQGVTKRMTGNMGEAIARDLAQSRGYQILGSAEGFMKKDCLQEGYDLLCWNPTTRKYVIIEAKYTSRLTGDIKKTILNYNKKKNIREMDNAWIRDAANRMYDKGLIDDDLYDSLDQAINTNNIEKELVVVRNAPTKGKTIGANLIDPTLGFQHVDIVELGRAVT